MLAATMPRLPTSQILDGLLRNASGDHVTLAWLCGELRDRSFPVILLILAVIGMLPTVATFTGLLLLFPATQMILARPEPVLPRMIGSRRFSTQRMARLVRKTNGLVTWCERFACPRWATPDRLTRQVVGGVVLLLAISLLSPLPFAQFIPNFVIILIAVALLAADGLLLLLSLLLALGSLAISVGAIWATVFAATLI